MKTFKLKGKNHKNIVTLKRCYILILMVCLSYDSNYIVPNSGKPWTAKNEDAYIESRFLVIQILMTFAIQQWKIQSVVNLRGANPDIFYFTPAFTSNNNNLHEGMPLGME